MVYCIDTNLLFYALIVLYEDAAIVLYDSANANSNDPLIGNLQF